MANRKKVWHGRFEQGPAAIMEAFSRSVETDRFMWREDIAVNRAWAGALRDAGIYTADELKRVLEALDTIEAEFEQDRFPFLPADEDIHVAIERRLTELAGDAGAKIHTGRSRNDQVVTDFRLYLRREGARWLQALVDLQKQLVALAEQHRHVVLPGYTHLQQAQPLALAHVLLAYFWGIHPTLERLRDFYPRLNRMPLGSGALAGAGFPIDRQRLAEQLGFDDVTPNSIEATANRDFAAEFLFIVAGFYTFLSRVCAEWQLWSSQEFRFLEFSDAFATGSSMMPQKKNPDAMELIRGKAAVAIAALQQMLILQKGLPLSYQRDLQEDKPLTFRIVQELTPATELFREAAATARFHPEAMAARIDDLLYATDLADFLVSRGVPFREAHAIVGQLVRDAEQRGLPLSRLPLTVYRQHSPHFDASVFEMFDPQASLARRNVEGGTGSQAVEQQLEKARNVLQEYRSYRWITNVS